MVLDVAQALLFRKHQGALDWSFKSAHRGVESTRASLRSRLAKSDRVCVRKSFCNRLRESLVQSHLPLDREGTLNVLRRRFGQIANTAVMAQLAR